MPAVGVGSMPETISRRNWTAGILKETREAPAAAFGKFVRACGVFAGGPQDLVSEIASVPPDARSALPTAERG